MIARRLRQGKDVAGIVHLVKYITNPQGKNHRVGEVFITNCISDTPMMAVREMLAKQLLNTRSQTDKNYHLLVSFQQGEQPTTAQLRKIETALCARLGYDQHQRVTAVHYDTDNTHMHIAINKIHPKKLTIHTPYYDFPVLGKACVELEQQFRLARDNHEPTGKTRGERQAKDIEALTGNESLHTWIHREVFEKLKAAPSWDALHTELAKAGLTLSLRGAGVVITSTSGHRITGSNLHRSFSKLHLEKRLGPFQPRPEWCAAIRPEKQYLRTAQMAQENPLREEYEKQRDAGKQAKEKRLAEIALALTKKKEVLLAENVLDRARAKSTPLWRVQKRRLYAAIHQKYRSQMDALMAETKRARKAAHSEWPRQNWTQWLQAQAKAGRTDAIEALRKRAFSLAKKNTAALRGKSPAEPRLIPDLKIDGVTKRGTVIYDLGADAVRDDGDSFRISARASADTDVMALRMAQRRFGNVIFVDGDYAFRSRILRAAVEGKVFIKFGDPIMERQRNEMFQHHYQERKKERQLRTGPVSSTQRTGLSMDEMWNRHSNSVRNPIRREEKERPRAEPGSVSTTQRTGLSFEERWNRDMNVARQPARHKDEERPQVNPGSASKGLSMAEMWNLHSNSTRNPVRHKEEEQPQVEIGSVHDASRMGLSDEEIRKIIRGSVRKPERSAGQTKDVLSSNGHDRDDESTRGASMSR